MRGANERGVSRFLFGAISFTKLGLSREINFSARDSAESWHEDFILQNLLVERKEEGVNVDSRSLRNFSEIYLS